VLDIHSRQFPENTKIYFDMKINIKSDHDKPCDHKCKVCSKGFPTGARLKKHRIIHSEERKFPCMVCGKSFKVRNYLKTHTKQVHNGEKPFFCVECGKSFANPEHRLVHTVRADKLPCHTCGKQFLHKKNLNKHLIIHGDSNNAEADVGSFTNEFKVKVLKKVEEEGLSEASKHFAVNQSTISNWVNIASMSNRCQFCGKNHTNKSSLDKHISCHHTGDNSDTKRRGSTTKKYEMEFKRKVVSFALSVSKSEAEIKYNIAGSTLREWMTKIKDDENPFIESSAPKSVTQNVEYNESLRSEVVEFASANSRMKAVAKFGIPYCTIRMWIKRAEGLDYLPATSEKFNCEKCGKIFQHKKNLTRHLVNFADGECSRSNRKSVPKRDQISLQTFVEKSESTNLVTNLEPKPLELVAKLPKKKLVEMEDKENLREVVNSSLGKEKEKKGLHSLIKEEMDRIEGNVSEAEEIWDEKEVIDQFETINENFTNFLKTFYSNNAKDKEIGKIEYKTEDLEHKGGNKDTLKKSEFEESAEYVNKTESNELSNKGKDIPVQTENENYENTCRTKFCQETLDPFIKAPIHLDLTTEVYDSEGEQETIEVGEQMVKKEEVDEKKALLKKKRGPYKKVKSQKENLCCSTCGESKSYWKPSDLERHMIIHRESKAFHCDICLENFAHMVSLKRHKRTNHTGDCLFKCIFCGAGFNQKDNMVVHERKNHGGTVTLNCQNCDLNFKSRGALTNHNITIHKQVSAFKCDACGKGLSSKHGLKYHMSEHTGNKQIKQKVCVCESCGQSFTQKDSLKKHIDRNNCQIPKSNSSKDETKVCKDCGKEFKETRSLELHAAITHKGEKNFSCTICGKCFGRPANLKVHALSHTGQLPFKCNFCEVGYKEKRNLNKHIFKEHTQLN